MLSHRNFFFQTIYSVEFHCIEQKKSELLWLEGGGAGEVSLGSVTHSGEPPLCSSAERGQMTGQGHVEGQSVADTGLGSEFRRYDPKILISLYIQGTFCNTQAAFTSSSMLSHPLIVMATLWGKAYHFFSIDGEAEGHGGSSEPQQLPSARTGP